MKTIGMLGGMGWESTLSYHKDVNEGVKQRLGGLHSARASLYSVHFEEIEKLQHTAQWGKTGEILSEAARAVAAGGADFLLICTGTMHKVAPQGEAAVGIPLPHIADATAEKSQASSVSRVGLLGTRVTMEQDSYKQRIVDNDGIEVLVPD